MDTVIRNQVLSVTISSLGAEAVDIRRRDLDCRYLWSGDARFWSAHSPLLFPMVCAANNGEIKVDGRAYPIGNHGFARKFEFALLEATETTAVYQLTQNAQTLEMYPFKFALTLAYTLSDNKLVVDYQVENRDSREIYFQIGTHSGFNCPLDPNLAFDDYYLEFDQPEDLERHYLNAANVRIPGKSELMGPSARRLPLAHSLFAEGALVFPKFKSRKVSLKSDLSPRSVAVSYMNLPHMGFWQSKEAPFVCIEPWHGLADEDGYTGEFKDRAGVVSLPVGQSFHSRLIIETN